MNLDPLMLEKHNLKLKAKYDEMRDKHQRYEMINVEGAEIVIVAYGSMARIVRTSIEILATKGVKCGMIRPITIFPFPEKAFKKIISPMELNKTKIKIQWQDPISAPIAKGDKVGNIFIDIPGKELIKQNIVSSQSIDTMSTFMKAKSILMYLLYGEFVVK